VPSHVRVPVFAASTSALTAAMRARMTGVSWHRGCPVSLASLRLLRLSYWDAGHRVRRGELIVSESAAASVTQAFRLLFGARFPITRMQVVDDFAGDDERSMLADNTSAFNCRLVPGTDTWSQHAYGLAVDVNPFENPEISGGKVDPPAAAAWADRSRPGPAAITRGDAAWRAFAAIGWIWGGDWQSPKDYMHFSANGL
jgi:D-alanyl-D-alanine carboxypeptidase